MRITKSVKIIKKQTKTKTWATSLTRETSSNQ